MIELSEEYKKHATASLNLHLLQDACFKAAEAAVDILSKEGQPQVVPHDPVRWRKELVYLIGMTMTVALSNKTGQGVEAL